MFFWGTKNFFLSPIEEISLQPELSIQPHLRIMGGYYERDLEVGVAGLYFGRFDNALVDSFIIQEGEELPEEQKWFVEKVTENWNI